MKVYVALIYPDYDYEGFGAPNVLGVFTDEQGAAEACQNPALYGCELTRFETHYEEKEIIQE